MYKFKGKSLYLFFSNPIFLIAPIGFITITSIKNQMYASIYTTLLIGILGTLPTLLCLLYKPLMVYRFGYTEEDSSLPIEAKNVKNFLSVIQKRYAITVSILYLLLSLVIYFIYRAFYKQMQFQNYYYDLINSLAFWNFSYILSVTWWLCQSIYKNWDNIQNK